MPVTVSFLIEFLFKFAQIFNSIMRYFLFFLIILMVPGFTNAQEHIEFKRHRLAAYIGHAHIPRGAEGELVIPYYGLDYEFWINPKFAIGFHNEIETESYLIIRNNEETLERSYPVIISMVGVYNIWKKAYLYAGLGYEFEQTENFALYRLGIEYEFEFGHHWDFSPGVFYDKRQNVFDAWSLGLGIGKKF